MGKEDDVYRDLFLKYDIGKIFCGDTLTVLKSWPDEFVQCCVTSPPYWGLRDYGVEGQLGLEKTPEEYVAKMVEVFREIRRVLRPDGTVWINLGDSYSGSGGAGEWSKRKAGKQEYAGFQGNNPNRFPLQGLKPKDLVGIPWRVAFALQADGWWLRSDIIWHKPNPMPESVTDRPTKSHEYIFLLSKSAKYYWDQEAVKEKAFGCRRGIPNKTLNNPDRMGDSGLKNGWSGSKNRNIRSVWTIATQPYPEAHFATYPEKLVEPCVKSGCPEGGIVLDPFMGSGTTALVALKNNRKYIGIELSPQYIELANKRLKKGGF